MSRRRTPRGARPPLRNRPDRALPWSELVADVLPALRELAQDASPEGVAAYLARLAAEASRLVDVPAPASFAPSRGFPADVGFHLAHRDGPFLAVQFRLAPHAVLPCHPHPGYSVCTLLLAGSARVENHELVGEDPGAQPPGRVLLRRTRDELLLPGRLNRLGLRRSNVHGMRAGPEGALGIDLTTLHDAARKRPDSVFEVDREPVDAFRGLVGATWRPK